MLETCCPLLIQSMAALSDGLARFIFNVLVLASLLPAWLVAVSFSTVHWLLPDPTRARLQEKVAQTLILILVLEWRCVFALCIWIHIEIDGLQNFRQELGKSGRPSVLLMNHLSFLDTLLAVSFASLAHAGDVRVLVSNHVFKLPLLGTIMKCMGLPEVPFTGSDLNDLRVDSDGMEQSMAFLEEHVQRGGVAAWFPEANRNRGSPRQLQQFRAGAFKIPVKYDVEVWCVAMVGQETCWPVSSMLGGKPAHIRAKIVRLAESSHEMLAAGGHSDTLDERAKALFLAGRVRSMAQQMVEELLPLHSEARATDGSGATDAANGSTTASTLETSSGLESVLRRRD